MERDFSWFICPPPFSHSFTNTDPQFFKDSFLWFGGAHCPTHSGGHMIYAWLFLISLATVISSEADMPKLGYLEIHIRCFCQS